MRCSSLAYFLLAGMLIMAPWVSAALAQQTGEPEFAPGELIVGFNSRAEQEGAVQDLQLVEAQGGITRGDATSTTLRIEPIDATSIRVRLNFITRSGGRPTPAGERQLLEETAEILRRDNRVSYAHPNWILKLQRPRLGKVIPFSRGAAPIQAAPATSLFSPNDPVFASGLQWHYLPLPKGMNAVGAWKHTTGDKSVTVAVLDTGILPDHPDIEGSGNLLAGYDFVKSNALVNSGDNDDWDADPSDPGDACGTLPASWHGTHVAGTLGAGATNNKIGIAGVAWKISVLPVRVLGRCGGTIADIAAAIRWSAGLPVTGAPMRQAPADVINLSLGLRLACNRTHVGVLIEAIEQARQAGATIVAAAGNDSIDVAKVSPGGCANVISVGATDGRGQLAPYSNFGNITVMAPGGDLERDDGGSGYPDGVWSLLATSKDNVEGIGAYEGTSMASPHVAASLALAIATRPELKGKPSVIEQALREASTPECSGQQPCGAGRLDAEKLCTR